MPAPESEPDLFLTLGSEPEPSVLPEPSVFIEAGAGASTAQNIRGSAPLALVRGSEAGAVAVGAGTYFTESEPKPGSQSRF